MPKFNCATCGIEKQRSPVNFKEGNNYCNRKCVPKHVFSPSGEKHRLWKGDKVGYRALHHWVDRKLGKPSFCEECKTTMPPPGLGIKRSYFQWANVSGEYKREVKDWRRLCYICHKKLDLSRHLIPSK